MAVHFAHLQQSARTSYGVTVYGLCAFGVRLPQITPGTLLSTLYIPLVILVRYPQGFGTLPVMNFHVHWFHSSP